MRSKLLFSCAVLSVLLYSSLVVSVDAASMWSQTYGGEGIDVAFSLVATSDGGYAIAGTYNYAMDVFYSNSGDFWLVKTDENGILPEYSSFLVPVLVLTATAFTLINKKRLLRKRSQKP